MSHLISRTLFYKVLGWKVNVTVPHHDKCIICVAPHTSNWDFIIAELYYHAIGRKAGFLMKKEWFFWPLGTLFRHLGGIPVNRGKHTSMTDALAETARKVPGFRLCVTPEGTRSLNPEWKKGFYFIALKAELPILLYGVDFKERKIVCTKMIVPSGNVEDDMKIIKTYFKDFKGKRPELFSVGEI